uniref:UDENN domain-containing protein n=1 Tax=Oncorhynchus mykiss TaxID=8022 RepID=A0A8C7P0T1_ONCMY
MYLACAHSLSLSLSEQRRPVELRPVELKLNPEDNTKGTTIALTCYLSNFQSMSHAVYTHIDPSIFHLHLITFYYHLIKESSQSDSLIRYFEKCSLSPPGGSRRSVYVQSTLKRRPVYHSLERDLIQLQQQQLFQFFVVVSLRKSSPGNTYTPEITQQFPNKSSRHSREADDRLKAIPMFCFPDSQDWRPSGHLHSETFPFVLTGEDGSRCFCYCRKILPRGKGKRLPEVHCIVSRLGCFNLFAKILEEVERRREICPALVSPFMRSVLEAPFPASGRTITLRSFLPGSGNEVLMLFRPVDSRLEHVDFESLLQCLSVGRPLQVFASLLLERRVIFIADKLR